jgi:hypothetical protein
VPDRCYTVACPRFASASAVGRSAHGGVKGSADQLGMMTRGDAENPPAGLTAAAYQPVFLGSIGNMHQAQLLNQLSWPWNMALGQSFVSSSSMAGIIS